MVGEARAVDYAYKLKKEIRLRDKGDIEMLILGWSVWRRWGKEEGRVDEAEKIGPVGGRVGKSLTKIISFLEKRDL